MPNPFLIYSDGFRVPSCKRSKVIKTNLQPIKEVAKIRLTMKTSIFLLLLSLSACAIESEQDQEYNNCIDFHLMLNECDDVEESIERIEDSCESILELAEENMCTREVNDYFRYWLNNYECGTSIEFSC